MPRRECGRLHQDLLFLCHRDARSKKENGAKESSEGSVAM